MLDRFAGPVLVSLRARKRASITVGGLTAGLALYAAKP